MKEFNAKKFWGRTKAFLLGLGIAAAIPLAAQTPTIFNNIQVNSQTDLRGNIVNGTGSVTVNDSAVVTGTLDQRGAISNSTGNVSVNDALDVVGALAAQSTLNVTGKLTTAASATGGAGLNVPPGTAPTSPVNGDVWTTTTGLFARINGSTVGPYSAGGGTPGGMDTQVQFNDAGSFGGDAAFTFSKVTKQLSIQNLIVAQSGGAYITLNDTTGVVDARKVSWYEDPVAMNGKGGFCLLTDSQTDPIAQCATTPTRNFLSWVHTGSTIGSVSVFGGDDLELSANGSTASITSAGLSLTSTGEIDFLGGTFVSSLSPLHTLASATGSSGLNVPHGTAPTSPTNGDLWTTTTGLFVRINGSTVGPLGASSVAGSNTQVQFNDSSAFGGDAGLVYDKTGDILTTVHAVLTSAGGEYLLLTDTSQAADAKNTLVRTGTGGRYLVQTSADATPSTPAKNIFEATRSGSAVATIALGNSTDNPPISGNAVDMTPQTGTFVVTFDNACTTSPTVTFNYYIIGPVVTIAPSTTSGFSCTGDATSFAGTGADVPANVRPASTGVISGFVQGIAVDNAAGATFEYFINSSGNMQLLLCSSITACSTTGWTASGTRNYVISTNRPSFTYYRH